MKTDLPRQFFLRPFQRQPPSLQFLAEKPSYLIVSHRFGKIPKKNWFADKSRHPADISPVEEKGQHSVRQRLPCAADGKSRQAKGQTMLLANKEST